jgi:hypothetical protein
MVESHVLLMNCPRPDADELGLVAFGLPPLSTPMMESTKPMWWYCLQGLIVFSVVASNIHWQWTPNGYLATIIGGGMAFLATEIVNELLAWKQKRALRTSREQ